MTTNQSTLCPWWSEPVCTVVRCCWSRVRVPLYCDQRQSRICDNCRTGYGFHHNTETESSHFYTKIVHFCYVSFCSETLVLSQYTTILLNDSTNDIICIENMKSFYQIIKSEFEHSYRYSNWRHQIVRCDSHLRDRSIDRSDISPLHFNVDSEAYSTHPQHDSILIPSAFKMCNE